MRASVAYWLFVVFSLSLSGTVSGQSFLSGQVIDSLTRQPIPFVTVYFDGTTVGTTTDDAGAYSLPLNGIDGPATIVATHLGYRSGRLRLSDLSRGVDFVLPPAPTVTATVEVGDTDNRLNNLEEFRRHYLGTDTRGRQSSIENEKDIRFDRTYVEKTIEYADSSERHRMSAVHNPQWSEDGKQLTFEQATDLQAHSAAPLQINLPDLGYRVAVDLLHFSLDYRTGGVRFIATYYYQPYEGNGTPSRKHRENRKRAYYNSAQHFLRALYHGRLDEEGYTIFERQGQKTKPLDLYQFIRPAPEARQKKISGLNDRQIVILYYGDRRGAPLPHKRRRWRSPSTSRMELHGDAAVFRSDGTMPDEPLSFGGELGRISISRLLPNNYHPE